ncbi:class I SAM-dependent methyltransferase [Sphingomonas mucosissima]|uniref:Trans-aconitate 2-methyltransferase n=1 Tax=Sphingomonas mucosissima TaxID=370959 RepID=A0A245ZE20_9SPHN|nr:class I SAM-dependent methyltransferase [Sphingomonas mucosissima]OWK28001.1 trans-aconitate 2-methyltransferase [Sphingomonas mucosissima]
MRGYAVTAQYYDPLASGAHAETDRRIAAALAGLDVTAGPIVDVGAGTGLTTSLIAAALPEAEIWAVEPDPAMRPALMARVWGNTDLRTRVTILPFGILETPLPDRIAGAVLSASLVHLGLPERTRLWSLLAERLATGGRIIVEVQCPQAEDITETAMGDVQVGRMTYRGSVAAQRIGSDQQRWRMTYRAILDDREVACDVTTYDCWAISADAILEEATAAGLIGHVADELVILEHASR